MNCMYHFNEITTINVSVLPSQQMIADNFYLLKIVFRDGLKMISEGGGGLFDQITVLTLHVRRGRPEQTV